ncbi:alpha-ketoacid dehydrogenase subunit beta [Numidum massiliense]|uniref:alpha-ketoacid dehydrogenase subunit beta n=1 Tax=Numidum massiliense TaxID=1522315 RepID=UPI000B167FE3|nr:alpha-ketoacid dehydrogenase subunit beta [Numidum massiliense]
MTAQTMRKMNMVQALNDALDVKLATDERVLVLGEDVGVNGGVFRVTDRLYEKYGDERVIDTPLAESGIVGTAIGMALNGLLPVAEMQFLGFLYPAFEQIVSHVARLRVRSQGQYTVPLVIRAPMGAGVRAPELHSESVESFFVHTPGLKVVVPSRPADAKGLLISAIEDPDPVIFLEPTKVYRSQKEEVPSGLYRVPIGKGVRVQSGDDMTVIAWGAMVSVALEAAQRLKRAHGWTADVIDLRTLAPLDRDLVVASIKKTGRVTIVHEAHQTGGLGGELAALISEEAFYYLRSPLKRVCGYDVPVPAFAVEDDYLPTAARVTAAMVESITA